MWNNNNRTTYQHIEQVSQVLAIFERFYLQIRYRIDASIRQEYACAILGMSLQKLFLFVCEQRDPRAELLHQVVPTLVENIVF